MFQMVAKWRSFKEPCKMKLAVCYSGSDDLSTHTHTYILWMDEIHFAPPKKPWNGLVPL